MRKSIAGLLSLAVASTVGVSLTAPAAGAPAGWHRAGRRGVGASAGPTVDDLPNPLEDKRRDLREEAVDSGLERRGHAGRTAGSARSSRSARRRPSRRPATPGRQAQEAQDQYVELERETTDNIFVILAEFGESAASVYPDQNTNPNDSRAGGL